MTKRKQSYASEKITVTFDPNICIHSAVCLRALPEVFDLSKRHWVRPENAEVEKVVDTVKQCPSGALRYSLVRVEDSRIE